MQVYTQQRLRKEYFSVPHTECIECPVSLITPRSQALVEEVAAMRHVHQSVGASLDLTHLDARLFDAIRTIEIEDIRTNNARLECESRFR